MDPITPTVQPFVKLTQANMALLTEYWLSPNGLFQAAVQRDPKQPLAMSSEQVDAMSRLWKGLYDNYSRFMVECAQGGMTAWTQAQDRLQEQARGATERATEASKIVTGAA